MWSQFEASSNDDETMGNTFCTLGLFKISNEEKSVKNPNVSATLQNEQIVVAVDKSLIFLEDKSSNDCKFLGFDAIIDCFAVSRGGNLMVCCLSDGNIHGINIKGIPVFNLNVPDVDIDPKRTFVDIIESNEGFTIMTANGKIFKLANINEKVLAEIEDPVKFDDSNLLRNVTNTRLSSAINTFCCVQTFSEELFIACGPEHVYFISESGIDVIKYPENIKGLTKISNLDNYIVALSSSGDFVEVFPYTRTISYVKNPTSSLLIEDFKVLESNNEYIELLVLSRANDQSEIKILDFPSMDCKSELNLPGTTWLVSQQKSTVNMHFISGLNNEDNFVQTIEIKSITESDPEERFKKLLLRGRFDEAEIFAKQFDLSLEPLYEARVKKSVLFLQGVKPSSVAFEKKFQELMQQLTQIENKNFLVTLRMLEIPDRTCMTTFLEFILKNIDTNLYQNETNEINELLLRLETLRLTDPDECNLQWQRFLYNPDLARVAMEYFKSDVLLSCLIWSRHSSSIMPNLNLEKFYQWLSNIPSSVEPFEIVQWLKHFSPCLFQLYPKEMSHLVEWCLERTKALQFSNAWPEIGLEFINSINEIFKEVKFLFVDIQRSYHNNMEKIQQLIFTLEEMSVLKKSYHLTMTLDDYCKNSIEETAFRLLQRIQTQNLKGMVNDFLYPIFMERGGTPEEVVFKYIQFLCTHKNLGFWQERAVTAIDLLHNEENRLNSSLLVLKVSPVPWSSVVLPLAMLGTTSSHPVANSIFIEFKTQSVKMIKVKYHWPVDYFDMEQDRIKLVFLILKTGNPEMLDDIKTLIKSSPDIAQNAYSYVMNHLVLHGKLEEFADLIAALADEYDGSDTLFRIVTRMFMRKIDENDPDDPFDVENFIEGLKLLIKQLMLHCDDFEAKTYMKKIDKLKKIVQVRKEFKLDVKLRNLDRNDDKQRLLKEGISLIASEVSETKSVDKVWSKVELLVRTFDFSCLYGFKLLCQKLNNLHVTCYVIDTFLQLIDIIEEDEIEDAVNFVVLLLSQQINFYENNLKSTFENYDPLALPLAYELLLRCLSHYNLVHHSSVMELLNWTRIGRNFYPYDAIEATKTKRVISSAVFTSRASNGNHSGKNRRETFSMFEDFEVGPTIETKDVVDTDDRLNPVLRCICNAIKVIVFALDPETGPYNHFKSHINKQDEVSQIKTEFFESLETLVKLKLYEPVVQLIQLLVEKQNEAMALIIPQMFVTTINKKVLKFLLSQEKVDYMAAFKILRAEINRDECIDYLRSCLKNNSQKIAFSTFSEMYNNYIGNIDSVANERQNRLKYYYYSELAKYDPSMRFKSTSEATSTSDLLKDLENRLLSVELVKKLSKDFGWDYQKKLIQQIKIVLRKQDLEFEIKTDIFGKDEVVIKTTVENIRKKCAPYLNEITNNTMLGIEMQSFIKEINFYFYEMYLVVYELLEHAKNSLTMEEIIFRNVLSLLRHKLTGRRRKTDQAEVDAWQKFQPDNGLLPGISKYRLPFKPLMEGIPEEFLSDELNVETFEKYIPLISLHASHANVNAEDRLEACGFRAVKNSIIELKSKIEKDSGSEWNLKPTNNAFLQTILRMVSLIRDKSKRMAILYFNMNHAPEGSDQVEAAYECWKFGIAHEQDPTMSPTFRDLLERSKRKYPLLKTQHLLHLYGLTDDKLMQLVESPKELINALYHHKSILQPQRKDINKLCDELSQLYDIDLLSLQHKLIHMWLAFVNNTEQEAEVNETFYEDYIGNPAVEEDEVYISEENVIRAHYILSSWGNDSAMQFLVTELGGNSLSANNQIQLYECFAKMIDRQTESYMDLINPSNYLLIKSCHYLKQLGITMKPEKFKDLDKVELLKKIWMSHYNNSKGLEIMSFICLGFNIHLPQIWNGILKQMVSLKMVPHLSVLVELLSTQSKLLHLSHLKSAWECVIKEPFLHALKVRSQEQTQQMAKSLILLQKCPISTFLNLQSFIELCLRLDRPEMAAIFIAFVNDQKKEEFIEMLHSFDKAELKKNIIELEELGIAPVISKSVINALKL